jgi:hypothetical protein
MIDNEIHEGMKLPLFGKSNKGPSVLSTKAHNAGRALLNALANPSVQVGNETKFKLSPAGLVLVLAKSLFAGGGSGGMNYRGTYDITKIYAVQDVVRVRSGSSQGVWICVVANGAPTPQAPTWPEPHDVDISKPNYWEMLALPPKSYTGCSGGASKTFYIGMIET